MNASAAPMKRDAGDLLARLRFLLSRVPGVALMGIWFAVILHFTWAALLFTTGNAATHATALSTVHRIFPNATGLALVLVTVAGLAVSAIFYPVRREPLLPRILLLIPQQIVLGMSAGAALNAMIAGHFADGVHRPVPFLIADQIPAVLAFLVHSTTIVYLAVMGRWLTQPPR